MPVGRGEHMQAECHDCDEEFLLVYLFPTEDEECDLLCASCFITRYGYTPPVEM